MFKLNEDAPAQHKALLGVAGVMIFLSLIDAIRGPSEPSNKAPVQVSEYTGSRYRNPRLSLIEKIFCRGYQRSMSCGFSFYHPMRGKLLSEGKRIEEKAPEDGVVVYRGYLKGEREGLGGKWEFDPD